MSDPRRFSESEIREVFERAAAEQERSARHHADEGLTLEEMQEVAASAGIDPTFVAAAARSVALGEPEQGRQSVGFVPRGVFLTEFLPGPPTDALWEHVLADVRRTFAAQGTVTEGGRVREWRNGNLRVTLEPAGDATRLHLRTRRDETPHVGVVAAGVAAVGVIALLLSVVLAGPSPGDLAGWLAMIVGGGLGSLGVWSAQRRWAETREQQFAEVGRRAAAVAGETPSAVPEARAPALIDAAALDTALDLDALADTSAPARRDRPRTRG